MRTLFLTLALFATMVATAATTNKISDYPSTTIATNTDLFLLASGTTNKHIVSSNLMIQIGTQIRGSNYLTGTLVDGSNYLTGSLVAGSNYLTGPLVAGSKHRAAAGAPSRTDSFPVT